MTCYECSQYKSQYRYAHTYTDIHFTHSYAHTHDTCGLRLTIHKTHTIHMMISAGYEYILGNWQRNGVKTEDGGSTSQYSVPKAVVVDQNKASPGYPQPYSAPMHIAYMPQAPVPVTWNMSQPFAPIQYANGQLVVAQGIPQVNSDAYGLGFYPQINTLQQGFSPTPMFSSHTPFTDMANQLYAGSFPPAEPQAVAH
jgi:hypothetical protein